MPFFRFRFAVSPGEIYQSSVPNGITENHYLHCTLVYSELLKASTLKIIELFKVQIGLVLLIRIIHFVPCSFLF